MEKDRRRKGVIFLLVCFILVLCFLRCKKEEKRTSIIYDLIEDFEAAEVIQETDQINFRDKKVNPLLLKGWSSVEKTGTWATALSSELRFYTFFPHKDQRIILKCSPFSYPNSPAQYMTLSLNKNHVASCKLLEQKERYHFMLPAEYLQKGENILTFEFSYAKSPADVLGKKDKRNLAAKFKDLHFLDKKANTKNIFKEGEILVFNPLSKINYYLKLPRGAQLLFDLESQKVRISKVRKNLKLGIYVTEDRGKEKKIFEIPFRSHLKEKTSYALDLSDFEDKIIRLSFRFDFAESMAESKALNFYGKLLKPRIEGKKEMTPEKADISKLLRTRDEIKKTNLIIAVLDAAVPPRMSCYGYERETTPVIDHIAAEGFLFTHAYAQASWTLPSITSLFTSTYPITHRVWSLERKLSDEAFTLAEALKEKGFKTCAITATASASSVFNLFQGFDEKFELYDEEKDNLKSRYRKLVVWAEDFLRPGLDWMQRHKNEQFFMYLHYLQPHEPYNPPEPFRDEFGRFYKSPLKEKTHLTPSLLERAKLTREDLEYFKAAYDENLKYADFYLGKFLQGLKDLGIYENTIVVIMADHGEAFLEHGSMGHSHTLYEEEIRIPLIIKFPNKFGLGGEKRDALVQSIDLMPTFMDIYGLKKRRQDMQGKSLLPLFFEAEKEINEFSLSSLSKPFVEEETRAIALVDKQYKLIVTKRKKMFFNLEDDPEEKQNIYAKRPILSGYYEQKLSKLKNEYMALQGLALKGKYILDRRTREHLKALGYLK